MAKLVFLRDAFEMAMHDENLQGLAVETGRSLDYASAEELAAYFASLMQLSPEMQDYFADSIQGEL